MPRLIPRTGWNALILTLSTAAAAAAQSRPAQILRYIGQTLNPEPTMSLDTLQYSGPRFTHCANARTQVPEEA
jgi:hypothetical protein